MQTKRHLPQFVKLAITGLALSWLAGCSSNDGDSSPQPTPPPPALPQAVSAKDLTNVSADNYGNNRWGLIEATTLETFATRWNTADTAAASLPPNGRPTHLANNARLVVLQLNGANRAAGENFVPANPANNVYVYQIDDFRFNEVRDTGLISNSVRYQASGATTDAWLKKYGIDLSRDFIVFAAGENTAANGGFFQDLGRATYWLSYWGADVKNVAVLNGTLQKNYVGSLVDTKTADSSVANGDFSVKSIRADHTALTIPLEDLLDVVDDGSAATGVIDGFGKQLIIDARPTPQFNRTAVGSFNDDFPGQFITTAWNSAGAPSNDATGRAKNYVLYEGHIKSAVSFPWAGLLSDAGDNNWKYKSKSDLEAIFTAAGYAPARKADTVIVSQCRTNFEVQVNGFAARLILGYPTVFFDGSLVEYTSLVSNHPDAALNLKSTDAAYQYRTDTAARSQFYAAGATVDDVATTTPDDNGVSPYNIANGTAATDRKIAQAVVNRNATTTRKALDEDREYKRL